MANIIAKLKMLELFVPCWIYPGICANGWCWCYPRFVIYTLYSVGASICAAALSAWSLPPEEFSQRLDGTCPSSQSH